MQTNQLPRFRALKVHLRPQQLAAKNRFSIFTLQRSNSISRTIRKQLSREMWVVLVEGTEEEVRTLREEQVRDSHQANHQRRTMSSPRKNKWLTMQTHKR